MNNKLLPIIGVVGVVALVGVSLVLKQGNPGKKEISVGTDICGEFPASWVQNIIGKPIVKTEPFSMTGTYACDYFINDTETALIEVNDLSVATQKKGQGEMGRTIKTDDRIPMEHFIAWQGDGLINSIYLVLTPDKFVSIDRTSTKVYDNEGEIALAIKVAQRIQKRQNVGTSKVTTTVATTPVPTKAPTSGPTKAPASNASGQQPVVDNFLKAISDGNPSEAVMMMTTEITGNDADKQAWAVQFNIFSKFVVKSVEPIMKEDWTDTTQEYKFTVDVAVKPGAAIGAPIPNYGWENGTNVRFVTLEKTGSDWKIQGIATGP